MIGVIANGSTETVVRFSAWRDRNKVVAQLWWLLLCAFWSVVAVVGIR